jgi:hypothetical protein
VIPRASSRATLCVALALLALGAPAAASPAPGNPAGYAAKSGGGASAANATSGRGTRSPAKPGVVRHAAAKPVAADSLTRGATASRGGRIAPRTLEDIHIEGEIPVPQVLFITARDQRRFMEFQHHRYERTSLELGRATAMPSRVVVPGPGPAERKENQR